MNKHLKFLILVLTLTTLHACGSDDNSQPVEPVYPYGDNPQACAVPEQNEVNWNALNTSNCYRLSEYGLFSSIQNNNYLVNSPGIHYELNSSLFTDHARKYRYIFLPPNTQMQYDDIEAFDFPLGSVIVKIFSLPQNTAEPNEQLIEIRLLIKRDDGWLPLTYHWHEEFSEAYLSITGKVVESSIVHEGVGSNFDYLAPSRSQCSNCHIDDSSENIAFITPIGLKARHLNRSLDNESNQLRHWEQLGLLAGLPDDLSSIDTAPDWRDTTANLQDRAKAYLDINCGHCHSEGGAATLSGLRLEYWRKTLDYKHGVCNLAHGWRGGGFDIWPGNGEESSIPRRMGMTGAKDRMPPIGRSLIDQEAIDLMIQWINSMEYYACDGDH